jgi:hypothetical protein
MPLTHLLRQRRLPQPHGFEGSAFSRKRAATFSYSPGGFPVATNGLAGPTLVLEALILWLKCGEANDVEPEGTGLGVSGIG